MKNIPVYMGQGGTASLILSEIPLRGTAYILLRTVLSGQLEPLLEECAGFCRSCGARRVLVSREKEPLDLPHAYDLIYLRAKKAALPQPDQPCPLTPMGPDNDAVYQRVYNRCFADVSHALSYDRAQIQRIYRARQQAFLALDESGAPWAMGELHGNELAAVGILPEFRGQGRSRDLTLTLLQLCPGQSLTLTVASDNAPALALYDSLGFTVCGRDSSWYEMG